MSSCGDSNKDHKCDVCGAKLSDCADTDSNFYCDTCGKVTEAGMQSKIILDADWLAKGILSGYTRTRANSGAPYVTLTTKSGVANNDYNITVINSSGNIKLAGTRLSNYLVIRYRTTAQGSMNEIHLNSTNHGLGTINPKFDVIADGQWHNAYINLAAWGLSDIDNLNILRFDLLNNLGAGASIDLAWFGFFYTPEGGQAYDELFIDFQQATEVTGHKPGLTTPSADAAVKLVDANSTGLPMVFAGSFKVGDVDLSKYSKAIVYFAMDASDATKAQYNALATKHLILASQSVPTNGAPTGATFITSGEYPMPGTSWKLTQCEIDLTNVNYNGPVYLFPQNPGGTWMVFYGMRLVP